MTVAYSDAAEVESVARPLITEHHRRLDDVEMRYVFRNEAANRGGLELIGDVKKVQGLASYLVHAAEGEDEDGEATAPMFVLVIAKNLWENMDDWLRQALVDHLLCRCGVEQFENGPRLSVLVPTVQEFPAVIGRHGMWRQSLRDLVLAAYKSQPSLFDKATLDALSDPPAAVSIDDDDDEDEDDDPNAAFGAAFDTKLDKLTQDAEDRDAEARRLQSVK